MIKLYNTMSRKKEEFKPIVPGQVGMYTCGPTVYFYAHLGNMRTYIFEDVLKRMFLSNGFKVKHVMNYTDVGHLTSDAEEGEDKMMRALKREGKPLTPESLLEVASYYARAFEKDMERLNIIKPDILCRATEHIPEMIELIKKLEKRGYTYKTGVGLIYDTSKYKDYAKLGRLSLEQLKQGARLEPDPERRNPSDFALWITNQPTHIMQWDTPWGRGFPGWHLECSAMSMKYLGNTFDVHCGGIDHIPIHHTNEIAQSEGATGKKFVNYWIHGAFLVMGEAAKKMAKSTGGVLMVQTLVDMGIDPLAYRYFVLTSHYRSELAFSFDAVKGAETTLKRLYDFMARLREVDKKGDGSEVKAMLERAEKEFHEKINDDLDTPRALVAVHELIKEVNKLLDEKKLSERGAMAVHETVLRFDEVLGLDLGKEEEAPPEEIKLLLDEREAARKQKNFKRADEIRKKIKERGWIVEDTPAGPRVRKA